MLSLALAAALAAALAQTPVAGFDLEQLALNPGARETLALATADSLQERTLRVALVGHYEYRPLVLLVNGVRQGKFIAARVTTQLLVGYGVTRWAELGLQVPVVVYQAGDDFSALGLERPPTSALGAPSLQARFAPVLEPRAPLDAAIAVALTLPLGSSEAFTRDPGLGAALAVRAEAGKTLGALRLGGQVGGLLRGAAVLSPSSATNASVTDEVGSLLFAGIALSGGMERLRGELAVRGVAPLTRSSPSLEVLAAVRVPFSRQWEASLLGGPGLGRTPGTPAFRVLVGLAWTPHFGEPVEGPSTALGLSGLSATLGELY